MPYLKRLLHFDNILRLRRRELGWLVEILLIRIDYVRHTQAEATLSDVSQFPLQGQLDARTFSLQHFKAEDPRSESHGGCEGQAGCVGKMKIEQREAEEGGGTKQSATSLKTY